MGTICAAVYRQCGFESCMREEQKIKKKIQQKDLIQTLCN